jgi:Big-like domain-containing protein/WD40 repeat protein
MLAAIGCGSSGESGTEPSDSGMRILAGANVTDTIFAKLPQALTVEVRPNGRAIAGLVVRFQALSSEDPQRQFDWTVLVAPLTSNQYATFAVDSTDARGRAKVLVQLGQVAGPVTLLVTCPELGLSDTARFTVTAGSAARLAFTPHDTVLLAGATMTVKATTTDYYGNPRKDGVTFASSSPLATVSSTGTITAGQTVGRAAVSVRAGSEMDSVRFTIVPDATIASLWFDRGGVGWIATSKLDGSGLTALTNATTTAYPRASTTSDMIVYHQIDGGPSVYVVDGTKARRRLLDPSVMEHSLNPAFSADGQFVYFAGRHSVLDAAAIWRVRPDGTGLQQISTTTLNHFEDSHPAPSPDGTRVVYSDQSGLVMLTLPTGAITVLSANGANSPVFSQDGQRLAYIDLQAIFIRKFDGSPPTIVASGLLQADGGLTWLPDGKWILARGFYGPFIVNATTGEVWPLTSLRDFYQMSARP